MFTSFSRFLILIFCIILSVIGSIFGIWPLLIVSTIVSLVILWGYYNVGTVNLALAKMRRNEFEDAGKLLDEIKNPDRLNKKNKANYYFIRGMIAHEDNQFEDARMCIKLALETGMKQESDRAMALLAMTDMEMMEKKPVAAREYFLQLRNLKVSPGLMQPIRQMQEWLDVK